MLKDIRPKNDTSNLLAGEIKRLTPEFAVDKNPVAQAAKNLNEYAAEQEEEFRENNFNTQQSKQKFLSKSLVPEPIVERNRKIAFEEE